MPNDNPMQRPEHRTTQPHLDDPALSMPINPTSPKSDYPLVPPPPSYITPPIPNYTDLPTPPSQGFVPPSQRGNTSDYPPKQNSFWRVVATVMTVLTIIFAATTYLAYNHIINPPANGSASASTAVATPGTQQTLTSVATVSSTPTSSASTPSSNDYSTTQPGPGCDKSGGTWTPKGSITNITCGTVTSDPTSTWGYLYFQLPSNRAFSANNEISIAGGNLATDTESGYNCLGLAEQDANMGFLGTYCGNGKWFIYSISNTGAIIQTLNQGITSTRTAEQISLAIQGTTLSLSIDTEIYKASISSIQPIQVAIAVSEPGDASISIENFSYITPAS